MGNDTNLLMYQTEDGQTKINVRLENETVWMTQKAIAELFQKGVNKVFIIFVKIITVSIC